MQSVGRWGNSVTPTSTPEEEPVSGVHPVRKKRPRVIRKGTEREVVSGVSSDERDTNWSQSSRASLDPDSNDAQLLRDVPPHWGRR